MLNRERIKLSDQHRGIKDMRRLPDAIIVVDARLEFTAVKEANGLGIPIIAIVDSNTNPNNISYPIPANDDSIRTIQLLISSIADTILEANGKLNDNNTLLINQISLMQIINKIQLHQPVIIINYI